MKERFLEDPHLIGEYLNKFGYANIKFHDTYISFGRDEYSSPKSIVIRLKDNDALLVHDYARNQIKDIFSFVILQKGVSFKDVIAAAKDILGIESGYYSKQQSGFRGFYGKLKSRRDGRQKFYEESILDEYSHDANQRFLKDGISIEAQKFYKVGFDISSQSIIFPIRNQEGRIIGIKARINKDPEEDEQKYYYLKSCKMSSTLYNYAESYQYLDSSDVVYIVESEKSCMQAYTFGVRNIVALGSSSLSRDQALMLISLNAKKYVFLFDEGLEFDAVKRNIDTLRYCGIMKEFEIYYWNDEGFAAKSSPTDFGKETFDEIIHNKLILFDE